MNQLASPEKQAVKMAPAMMRMEDPMMMMRVGSSTAYNHSKIQHTNAVVGTFCLPFSEFSIANSFWSQWVLLLFLIDLCCSSPAR
jgi:hypothetical protein